jgi:hypothetical protein
MSVRLGISPIGWSNDDLPGDMALPAIDGVAQSVALLRRVTAHSA